MMHAVGPKFTMQQVAIGSVINSAMSLLFFLLVFGGQTVIALGAGSKFAMDFLVQALFVGFFSALPPSILYAKRTGAALSLGSTAVRVGALAALSLAVFGGGALAITSSSLGPGAISFSNAAVVKILFAIFITAMITPLAIRAAAKAGSKQG